VTRRPPAALALAFALGYVVVGLLSRTTVLDGTALALVWPAAGLPLLWFLLRDARPLGIDTPLLAAAACATMLLSGSGTTLALVVTVTNVAQTLLAVALLRRWAPEVYGAGGDRALDSPRLLGLFVAAIGVAMAVGAVLGTLGVLLSGGDAGLVTLALWFGRNLCGALGVGTLGLLALQHLGRPAPRPSLLRGGTGGPVELVAASVFAVLAHALVFALDDVPLGFALLAASVWFGSRFVPLVAATQAVLAGISVVVATLQHVGPFVSVQEPSVSALVAQLYVVTTIGVGLALATGRAENRRLTGDLRAAEADAAYQARLLDGVIATIESGIVVVDDTGEVRFRNGAAAAVIGRGPDLEGSGETGRRLGAPVARAFGGEEVRGLELVVGDDGDERVLDVSVVPLPYDGRRGRDRVLVLFRDATGEHVERAELLAFAGVVAHDLRNPLAAVEGWTDLIGEHLEQDELELDLAREFVTRVRSSTARMRNLIEDLLTHAGSRDRALTLVGLDVGEVVAEVARARGAEGEVSWTPMPAVLADPVLVRQLVDNLLGNALKYVAEDVRPDVRVSARLLGTQMVAVAVTDNGIGLPEGEHDKVFAEFHRAHHQEYDGSGLGLAICRRIVARHGGTIRAFDNPAGPGTVFELTLPAG